MAILEPVATHRDHRRVGHGMRVVHGLAAACRAETAQGLTVWTPSSNPAAVAAYQAAGFAVADKAMFVWLDRPARSDPTAGADVAAGGR